MSLVDIQVALMTDDLAGAINEMFAYDSEHNGNRLQNQIIHQSGRYHANEKSNNIGTISSENYNRTRNQLRYALQELLKDFPGYGPQINQQAQEVMINKVEPDDKVINKTQKGNVTFKVLMLTANPVGTDKLQLRDEHSRISDKLQNANNSDDFDIKSKWAVSTSEFAEALIDEKPNIVHFSGHGENNYKQSKNSGTKRGQGLEEDEETIIDRTGIYLYDDDREAPIFVSTEVLSRLFRSMVETNEVPIQVVLLNSCYSETQAAALAEIIPHVIGTSSAVKDRAAIAFATGFYSFLTRTKNIKAAWDNGVTQAMIKGEPANRFIYYENGEKVK